MTRYWFAWDAEYPEEGSIIVEAETEAKAREIALRDLDGDEEMPLSLVPATPRQVKLYEELNP